jgi:cytochrome c
MGIRAGCETAKTPRGDREDSSLLFPLDVLGVLAVQKSPFKRGGAMVLACIAVIALSACFETIGTPATGVPGGDAAMGKQAIATYGCGACHTIPGVTAAHGNVGPPLTGIADRSFIAGKLRNQPDNMILWIMNPQSVWPGNAMPNMNVTDADARNIAAYLYTLK